MKKIEGDYTSELVLEDLSLKEYEWFLKIKQLPSYEVKGNSFIVNSMFLSMIGVGNNGKVREDWEFNEQMFDYQKFIVKLALLKRKYAIFADCGLGKTFCFLEWIEKVRKLIPKNMKILIVSPLMILEQTREEQTKFYDKKELINIHSVGFNKWLNEKDRIGIVNYDLFRNPIDFNGKIGAIVLDESSIMKSRHGVIKTNLINASKGIEWKLCCTATPAPNDREEYANHALFLDQVRTFMEFFSRFFTYVAPGWILKPHAVNSFYRYLASFSIFLRDPKNYGFEDNLKDIPTPIIKEKPVKLTLEQQAIIAELKDDHSFGLIAKLDGITNRTKFSQISKGFLYGEETRFIESNKPQLIFDLVMKHEDEQIIIWTNYDTEGEILRALIEKERSVFNLTGKVNSEKRLEIIKDFKSGKLDVLISKSRLLGFGMNFQNCSVVIFSGLNDSYEQYYQALRRVYRYGNKQQVKIYIPVTSFEEPMYRNVLRKKDMWEKDAAFQENLYKGNLVDELKDFVNKEIKVEYVKKSERHDIVETDNYKLINGDNIYELENTEENSIDFCIFSPPFASLFTYSSDIADMGNVGNDDEFTLNYRFFAERLYKVMKPGRKICVHVAQLPMLKVKCGYIGMRDFRGIIIETMNGLGFQTKGEVAIKKNQQAKSIVYHVPGLSMGGFKKDSGKCIPCYNDYVLIFAKPGESEIPIKAFESGEMTSDDWIDYASGCWTDIRETDTLNTKVAKSDEDGKHICPLQLEVIRRFIKLYSNENDLVLDPFSGIGSTGVISMELGRKYLGLELKPEYFKVSVDYIAQEERKNKRSLGLNRRIVNGTN